MLKFQMFDFENLSQGLSVQQSQWCHSMANTKSLNVISRIFTLALSISEILIFQICDLDNLHQGHEVQHLQCRLSMANINRVYHL